MSEVFAGGTQLARLAPLGAWALGGVYPCSEGAGHTGSSARPALRLVPGLPWTSWVAGWLGSCVSRPRPCPRREAGRPSPATRAGSLVCLSLCSHRPRRRCGSQQGEDALPGLRAPSGAPGGRGHGLAGGAGGLGSQSLFSALLPPVSGTPPSSAAPHLPLARSCACVVSRGRGGFGGVRRAVLPCHMARRSHRASRQPFWFDRVPAQAAVRRSGTPPPAPRRVTVPRAPPPRAASWTSPPRSPLPARRESAGQGGGALGLLSLPGIRGRGPLGACLSFTLIAVAVWDGPATGRTSENGFVEGTSHSVMWLGVCRLRFFLLITHNLKLTRFDQ